MHHPGMQLTFTFRKDCFVFVSEYYQDHYIDHVTNIHADDRHFVFIYICILILKMKQLNICFIGILSLDLCNKPL